MLKMAVKNRKKKEIASINADESTTRRTTATSMTEAGSEEILQQKIAEINQILAKEKVWY